MNRISVSALTLAVTTLAAGHAMAANTGYPLLNEAFPVQVPTTSQTAGKTRAQVEAERQEAVRTGNVVSAVDGFGGQKLSEAFPGQYPAAVKAAGKTRAEVEAERQQAIRAGALNQYPAY